MVVTAVLAETLDDYQHSTGLIPESWRCTLRHPFLKYQAAVESEETPIQTEVEISLKHTARHISCD